MTRRKNLLIWMLILTFSSSLMAQAPSTRRKETKIFRTVGAFAGGLGGFALATATLDDDRNTTKEYTAAIILMPLGGALAGYFLGRAVDRRDTRFAPVSSRVHEETRRKLIASESVRIRKWLDRHDFVSKPADFVSKPGDFVSNPGKPGN